jgi:hypothetical protein
MNETKCPISKTQNYYLSNTNELSLYTGVKVKTSKIDGRIEVILPLTLWNYK